MNSRALIGLMNHWPLSFPTNTIRPGYNWLHKRAVWNVNVKKWKIWSAYTCITRYWPRKPRLSEDAVMWLASSAFVPRPLEPTLVTYPWHSEEGAPRMRLRGSQDLVCFQLACMEGWSCRKAAKATFLISPHERAWNNVTPPRVLRRKQE